jgi:PTH1 family peptidyl-tRNA hydrolase
MTEFLTSGNSSSQMKITKIIMGLGNPGRQYQKTRHNFGFMVIDHLLATYHLNHRSSAKNYLRSEAILNYDDHNLAVCLSRPLTYMNQSGVAARLLLKRYGLSPQDLLVIYDDLDLPLGKIRIRKQGSAGGHKGLQSIIERIMSQAFPRIRLGIGPQTVGIAAEDFVLAQFRPADWPTVRLVIKTVESILKEIFLCDIEQVMNKYNHNNICLTGANA